MTLFRVQYFAFDRNGDRQFCVEKITDSAKTANEVAEEYLAELTKESKETEFELFIRVETQKPGIISKDGVIYKYLDSAIIYSYDGHEISHHKDIENLYY